MGGPGSALSVSDSAATGGVGGMKKSRSGGDIGEGPPAAKQRVIVQPPSPVDEGFAGKNGKMTSCYNEFENSV